MEPKVHGRILRALLDHAETKQSPDTWWRAARWAYDAVQSYTAEIRRFTPGADLEEDQLLELFAREAEVDEHELRRLVVEWERRQESGAD